MTTPATLPDTPDVESGADRFLSNMFGGTISQEVGLNKMIHDLEQAWTKLGISESSAADTPVANTVLTSLTNGKSKWATIVTAMLAANAVTQSGVANTGGADSTTSATFVDMASLSVALTTTGGNVLVWMVGAATHSAAGTNVQVGFQVDAVATVSGPAQHSAATIGEAKDFSNIHLFTGLSAGAHTFKSRWLTSGGTVTAYGGRTMIAVELRR